MKATDARFIANRAKCLQDAATCVSVVHSVIRHEATRGNYSVLNPFTHPVYQSLLDPPFGFVLVAVIKALEADGYQVGWVNLDGFSDGMLRRVVVIEW